MAPTPESNNSTKFKLVIAIMRKCYQGFKDVFLVLYNVYNE